MLTTCERVEKIKKSLLFKSQDKQTISIDQVIEIISSHIERAYQSGIGQGIHRASLARSTQKKKKSLKKNISREVGGKLGFRSISVRSMLKNLPS